MPGTIPQTPMLLHISRIWNAAIHVVISTTNFYPRTHLSDLGSALFFFFSLLKCVQICTNLHLFLVDFLRPANLRRKLDGAICRNTSAITPTDDCHFLLFKTYNQSCSKSLLHSISFPYAPSLKSHRSLSELRWELALQIPSSTSRHPKWFTAFWPSLLPQTL